MLPPMSDRPPMLDVEVKHLRLMLAIVEEGTVTGAAQRLLVSQPALSKRLSELEMRLGFPLFHRTKKRMVLTDGGAKLYASARSLLADIERLESELARHAAGEGATLRLAIDPVHHTRWLPGVFAAFRQAHPSVELRVKRVPHLLTALVEREIDVAVLGERVDATSVAYHELGRDEIVAIVAADHPLRSCAGVTPHHLEGAQLLYFFELERSYLYQRYLRPQRVRLGAFHHVEDVDAIVSLVAAGQGVSLLPRSRVSEAVERGRVAALPIGEEGYIFSWFAAHADPPKQSYVSALVSLICDRFAAT